MKYYLNISPQGFTILVWVNDNDTKASEIMNNKKNYYLPIERTEALIISRLINRYIDNYLAGCQDVNTVITSPYVIPLSYLTPEGEIDIKRLHEDLKSGKINLVDKLIILPTDGK